MYTDELYENARPMWEELLTHPFVQGIGHGTLPIQKFRIYMIQDYLYLLEYAKVFALGICKSDTEEQMRFFAMQVESVLNGEMLLHKEYMVRLSITPEDVARAEPMLPNVSYISYMLSVAWEKDILAILVTILACAWSYEIIGKELAKIPGATSHEFYGEWVKGYASEEYAMQNAELLAMVNELADMAPDKEKQNLIQVFTKCSEYERGFWDMVWG